MLVKVREKGSQIQAGRIKKVFPTNRLLVEYNRRLCYYKIHLNRHRQHDFIQWFLGIKLNIPGNIVVYISG